MTRRDDDFPTDASARRCRDPRFFFFTRNDTSSLVSSGKEASSCATRTTRPLAWDPCLATPGSGHAPPPLTLAPLHPALLPAHHPALRTPASSPRWRPDPRLRPPARRSWPWYTPEKLSPMTVTGSAITSDAIEHHQHREPFPRLAHRRVIAVPDRRHRHPRPRKRRDDSSSATASGVVAARSLAVRVFALERRARAIVGDGGQVARVIVPRGVVRRRRRAERQSRGGDPRGGVLRDHYGAPVARRAFPVPEWSFQRPAIAVK